MKGDKCIFLLINYIILTFIVLLNKINSFDVQTKISDKIIHGNRKFIPELNKYIEVYLGIRYAQPPSRKNRFADPIPAQDLVLGMETFPPTCPQNEFPIFKEYEVMDVFKIFANMSEDCLFLNIWKPLDSSGPKPVIVFIHGGGYRYGSTSIPFYEGSYLAAIADAVVVTIQYRVDVFGFLYTGDDFASGNAGLKDQVLALKWIKEHIQYFGGDIEMITLIGESAGSSSVCYHLLSPETSKLFKRAVLLSGVPNRLWGAMSSSKALRGADLLASKLGTDRPNMGKRLENLNYTEILEVRGNLKTDYFFGIIFRPTIVPPVVMEDPLQLFKNAKHLKGKELIVSWTKNEGSFFVAVGAKIKNQIQIPSDIPYISKDDFIDLISFISDKHALTSLTRLYNVSSQNSNLKEIVEILDDIVIKCSTIDFIVETRKHGAIVYHLEYDFKAKNLNMWPDWVGTEHTADFMALFGHAFRQEKNVSPSELQLYESYLFRLKNFITTGDPNIPGQKRWNHDQMFIFSDKQKNSDNRTVMCSKLKKLLPTYFSGITGNQINIFGVLAILMHVIVSVLF